MLYHRIDKHFIYSVILLNDNHIHSRTSSFLNVCGWFLCIVCPSHILDHIVVSSLEKLGVTGFDQRKILYYIIISKNNKSKKRNIKLIF